MRPTRKVDMKAIGKATLPVRMWVPNTQFCDNPHCVEVRRERDNDRNKGYAEACNDMRSILMDGSHPEIRQGQECDCALCELLGRYKNRIMTAVAFPWRVDEF